MDPPPPRPAAVPLSHARTPHDEDTACWERTRRRSRGVLSTRRERGCRGRRHRTMARSEVPEDRACSTPRWPARAKTALPGRSRAVRSCGRIGRKCTTRTPSVPNRTSPSPRGYGERVPGAHVAAMGASFGDRVGGLGAGAGGVWGRVVGLSARRPRRVVRGQAT
eukprot:scaffold124783_cov45-Phaeocystis_antarctica.AAC.1